MQQSTATDNHLHYLHHYYQHLVTLIVNCLYAFASLT